MVPPGPDPDPHRRQLPHYDPARSNSGAPPILPPPSQHQQQQQHHPYHHHRHPSHDDRHHHPYPPPPQEYPPRSAHPQPSYPDTDPARRSPPRHGGYGGSAPAHAAPQAPPPATPYSGQVNQPGEPSTPYPPHGPPHSAGGEPPRPPPGEQHHHDHYRRHSMDYPPQYPSHGPTLAQQLAQDSNAPHGMHPPPGPEPPQMEPPMPQHYGPPPQHLPPQPMHYEGAQYAPYFESSNGPASSQRRKAVRAAQACDNCRTKKAKCDEARPSCGNCVQNGFECRYRSLPPPKQDRSFIQITDKLEELQYANSNELQNAVSRIIQEIQKAGTSSPGPKMMSHPESTPMMDDTPPSYPRAPISRQMSRDQVGFNSPYPPQGEHEVKTEMEASATEDDGPRTFAPHQSVNQDLRKIQYDAFNNMMNGELAIPHQHTTAAHILMQWPSIKPFFDGVREKYVRDGEHKHHLDLSSYPLNAGFSGSGSVRPQVASPHAQSPPDDSSSISGSSDDRPAAAYVKVNCAEGSRGRQPSPGGRNSNQSLSIDEETAHRLLEAYFDHMHILQPFVDKEEARTLVSNFVASYCSEPVSDPQPGYSRSESANGIKKRKFTPGFTPHAMDSPSSSRRSEKKPIERTVENALVLLIFALGRICLHSGPLPPPINRDNPIHGGTPFSPIGSIPMGGSRRDNLSSDSRSPRPSEEHPDTAECKRHTLNIDRLPGAAYYSHAASILGEVHGDNSLTHIQAALLAALYLGQLVFVYDSWKWINTACTSWQMLFKHYDEDTRRLSTPELLAFWACLVLESDILAELELVPSGISKMEDAIPFPMFAGYEGEEYDLLEHFLCQIQLRKILNRAHTALYNTSKSNSGWAGLNAEQLELQLEGWRQTTPPRFRWKNEDPPARTINGARLRAKYWGGRNIIFRLFLHKAVNNGTGSQMEEQAALSRNDQAKSAQQVLHKALECIKAVKQSTLAFDALADMPQRLIVTNIFGTAHAQFGNCLVLGAACFSTATESNFTATEFIPLLNRTIRFLGYLAPLSPTMTTNVQILQKLKQRVKDVYGGDMSIPNSAHNSFGPGMGGPA